MDSKLMNDGRFIETGEKPRDKLVYLQSYFTAKISETPGSNWRGSFG